MASWPRAADGLVPVQMAWGVVSRGDWLARRVEGDLDLAPGATAVVVFEARDLDGDLVADVQAPLTAEQDPERYVDVVLWAILRSLLDTKLGAGEWRLG